MSDYKYTKDHEWIKIDESGNAIVGITDYAVDALGDLVFIELPKVGAKFEKGKDFSVVESVKTASEIYAPLAGEVVEVNSALADNVDLLKEAHDKSWIAKFKIDNASELNDLIDKEAYDAYINEIQNH
jgi:glycine cleavage system H protein